jgi:hypothetical protein
MYPIGNNPLFPNKSVYTDVAGRAFDLTDLEFKVWAAHMVRVFFLSFGCEGTKLVE